MPRPARKKPPDKTPCTRPPDVPKLKEKDYKTWIEKGTVYLFSCRPLSYLPKGFDTFPTVHVLNNACTVCHSNLGFTSFNFKFFHFFKSF